jgi:hypothetical protein
VLPVDVSALAVDPRDTTAEAVPLASEAGHRPWSRRRKVVLGGLLAAAVAAVAVSGPTAWQVITQRDARLTVPASVAGLARDNSSNAADTIDYLRTGLVTDVQLDRTVGAAYRDPADHNRSVLLVGGTALIWRPGSELDSALTLLSDSGGGLTGVHDVDAGGLGGTMKCGSTTLDQQTLAVCGWADHGSLALAMFPGSGVDEAADLLRRIRPAVQSRG